MRQPKVIYEDSYILILEKPNGWITDRNGTAKDNPVLQDWVEEKFQIARLNKDRREEDFFKRSGIVHRLDKETSGLILVAKTLDSFKNLQDQFKRREIKKTYEALVHGRLIPREGQIQASVGRLPWRRERFGVISGGREATTKYSVRKYFEKDKDFYTLLSLYPKTGRTHQIRVHLKFIGFPVVSDQFYAGRKTSRRDRTWCPRLFLHASGIEFKHPKTQKVQSAKSDLPWDLKKAVKQLSPAPE